MADLSQYVDFTFKIDISGLVPICSISDISNYPVDAAAFQGFVSITQPDGISISPNFSTPDIQTGALTATKSYRLANDSTFQNGNYSITYTVKCTGYTDTVITKTFTLGYTKPMAIIGQNIDVFTPLLSIVDNTNFIQSGLTLNNINRLWNTTISNVDGTPISITGTSQIFNLGYNNNYYDASYYNALTDVVTYGLSYFSWVSIIDKLTLASSFDIYTPKTLAELKIAIDNYASKFSNQCDLNNDSNYVTMTSLYNTLITQGQSGNTIGLQTTETALENLLFPNVAKVHTNAPIPTYLFNTEETPFVILPSGTVSLFNIGGLIIGQDLSGMSVIDAFVKMIAKQSTISINFYYGWSASSVVPSSPSTLQFSGSFDYNGNAVADFTTNTSPNYLILGTDATQPKFTTITNGNIIEDIDNAVGGSNLFYSVISGNYRYYITNYATEITTNKLIFNR